MMYGMLCALLKRKSNQVGFCAKPEPTWRSFNSATFKKRNGSCWLGKLCVLPRNAPLFFSCMLQAKKPHLLCLVSARVVCYTVAHRCIYGPVHEKIYRSSKLQFLLQPSGPQRRNRGASLFLLSPRIGAGVENEPFEFILMKIKERKRRNPHFFLLRRFI